MSLTALWFLICNNKYIRSLVVFLIGAFFIIVLLLGFKTWLAVHDTFVAEKARNGYVTQVTLEALRAKLNEKERQHKAASAALNEYKINTVSEIKARDEANAKLGKAIAADTSSGCTWTADDLRWLHDH